MSNESQILREGSGPERKSEKYIEDEIARKYPDLISKHIESLLHFEAVRKQFIPSPDELNGSEGSPDALSESKHSVFPHLIRRYENRAALIISERCFAYCRHCFRKNRLRFASDGSEFEKGISDEELDEICEWISKENDISEILVTGGDPLTLTDERLNAVFKKIRKARSSMIIRLGSRAPLSCPERITEDLCKMLKSFDDDAPVFFMTHFNHADELQKETLSAIKRIRKAGISLFNQSVILKGVNDTADDLALLSRKLLACGIKPYYAFISDRISGTEHFWVSPLKALEIEKELRQRLSGMEMPTFAADLPDGGGKVPLVNCYIKEKDENGKATLWTPDFNDTKKY